MMFQLAKWGSSLGTRQIGREVKKELDLLFEKNVGIIEFNFDGVNLVTNSFADELFGKKIMEIGFDEFKKRTTFTNVDRYVSMSIRKAVDNRRKELSCV